MNPLKTLRRYMRTRNLRKAGWTPLIIELCNERCAASNNPPCHLTHPNLSPCLMCSMDSDGEGD